MYVDNATMQLLSDPKQFDTIVTNNVFGDILSDEASMITGSIGMLPSLSDSDKANQLSTILSAAVLLKYGLGEEKAAKRIEDTMYSQEAGLHKLDVFEKLEAKYKIGDTLWV